MKKINQHIEIVSSTSRGLSSMSRNSREAIQTALRAHYTEVGITIVNTLSDLEALVTKRPDLVFLGMKFVPQNEALGFTDPNKIWLHEYLAEHDIACTGSSSSAHRLDLEKPLAKQRVLTAGLATSAYCVVKVNQPQVILDMPRNFPLFVKPTDRGGGAGIDAHSVVYDLEQLQAKINSITRELGSDALVEEYLPGREFSVAILKNESSPGYKVMPLELIAPQSSGPKILSAAVKSNDAEQVIEVVDQDTRKALCELALDVFHAIGARDYGRVDIRLDQRGTPQFLEINLIPSLINGYGSFPKAWVLHTKLGYESMLLKIVRLGMLRSAASPLKLPENNLSVELALNTI